MSRSESAAPDRPVCADEHVPDVDFPIDFLWGAATLAHQVDGGNVNNDWWDFEHDSVSAAYESSGDGIDQLHRYAQDFTLLKSLGHNAHRLSLDGRESSLRRASSAATLRPTTGVCSTP